MVRLLIVLAIVPAALIAPAPPVRAAPPPVTFNYTSAANAPIGIDPQAIAVADLNGDGKQDLVVANCFSNTVSVLLGKGDGTFTPAPGSPIAVGTCPEAVVLTDLNGDGKPDLVVSNYNDGTVSLFLGNGNGTFTPKAGSPFAAGSTPNFLAVGDVTGDGKKDIVVTNTNANTVSVLAGDGNGGFGAPTAIATGSQPFGVALGDVDGAHGLDILVANSGDNTVSVLLNNGSGAFSPAPGSPITVGNTPQEIALGKINADNALDFAVTNLSDVTNPSDGSVSVFLNNNNGTGAFTQAAGSPIVFPNTSPVAIALDDINNDSKLDLVVSDSASFGTYVLTGNGNGTFSAVPGQPTITGGVFPIAVAVADVNGDGKKDILTVNGGDNTISVSLGNGVGAFTTISPSLPLNLGGSGAALGDFNGDGKPDIAVSRGQGTLFVNLGLGNGTFNTVGPFTVGYGVSTTATGDVNGDGKQDIVSVAAGTPNMVTVLLGDGHGGFTTAPGSPFSAGGSCSGTGLVVADLNGDGKQDLAIPDCNGNVDLYYGNGNGTFTAGASITGLTGADAIAAADLRGLGRKDLIVTGFSATNTWVLLNDGHGAFSNAPGSPLTGNYLSVTVADVNHDGKPDLIVPGHHGGALAYQFVGVLLGNGDGTFRAAIGSPHIASSGSMLAVGDLNNDGNLDIVAVGQSLTYGAPVINFVDVLLGNGDGTFVTDPGSPFPTGYNPVIPLIADLNGDGKPDIAVVGLTSAVLLNTSPSPPIPKPAPSPRPGPPPSGGPPPPAPPPRPGPSPSGGSPNPVPVPRR
ncbi:MAG: FG-GAP repeat domain-containing protein [Thermomicrobiales bacterium]